MIIGTKDGVTLSNNSALELFGAASLADLHRYPGGLPDRTFRWLDGTPLKEEEIPFVRALHGETVVEVYLAVRPSNDETRHLRVAAAPIWEEGQVTGAVTIHTDITDRQREAEALRAANEKAADACAELAKFTAHLEQLVAERTRELTRANAALQAALKEVRGLKERLEAENAYLQIEHGAKAGPSEVIGQDGSLKEVFYRINAVAPQDTTVLLLGETGTGKGVIAGAIHNRSARKDRPMVTVNCTALPANLIESELFGREKGAFTGAHAQQIGRFELADKGTIFLDEIGDLPLELQAKLLHVLQDRSFSRLGSPRTLTVDVRIIAATNRDLKEEMAKGRFREDLYYRLSIFPVEIPPLRQRRQDIPALVESTLARFCREMGKKIEHIPAATMELLVNHSWPGNVRELQNVIERAVITTQGSTLHMLDRFDLPQTGQDPDAAPCRALAEVERAHILHVLGQTRGRIDGKNGAALLLGLNPSTLRGQMRKERIERHDWL